mmetsp:Transcript_35435/g.111503  ORF Transcript_35435/g.111503 Transcript_35435/m.111503 type:complete len:241 (-) Transcript_35435:11-733(-)
MGCRKTLLSRRRRGGAMPLRRRRNMPRRGGMRTLADRSSTTYSAASLSRGCIASRAGTFRAHATPSWTSPSRWCTATRTARSPWIIASAASSRPRSSMRGSRSSARAAGRAHASAARFCRGGCRVCSWCTSSASTSTAKPRARSTRAWRSLRTWTCRRCSAKRRTVAAASCSAVRSTTLAGSVTGTTLHTCAASTTPGTVPTTRVSPAATASTRRAPTCSSSGGPKICIGHDLNHYSYDS